jgi:AcrR family transcriptional regulator
VEATAKPTPARPVRVRQIKTPTKNPERVRARREALINAAIEVFVEKGFHDATVRDIGRAAGMTQGTIYNYVRSKDDILYLVCDRIVSEYQEQTYKALESSEDPVQRVKSAVRAISEVMYRHRREVLLIYQESHLLEVRSLRVITARVEEFIAMFERIVSEAARELGVTLAHPHFAANILTFLPLIIVLRRWSFGHDLGEAEVIDEIAAFLVRGLGLEGKKKKRLPAASPNRRGKRT